MSLSGVLVLSKPYTDVILTFGILYGFGLR